MLRWLKDALAEQLIAEVRRNAKRYDVIVEMLRAQANVAADLALVKDELSTIHGLIFELKGTSETMSTNIDRIEKEAADLAEDVTQVRTAIEGLNTTISELKTTVADLQTQVAKGQLDQARLDAAAASLEKADDDLDAITLPGTPSEPPAEG